MTILIENINRVKSRVQIYFFINSKYKGYYTAFKSDFTTLRFFVQITDAMRAKDYEIFG
jgi:hypothetical protein